MRHHHPSSSGDHDPRVPRHRQPEDDASDERSRPHPALTIGLAAIRVAAVTCVSVGSLLLRVSVDGVMLMTGHRRKLPHEQCPWDVGPLRSWTKDPP